GIQIYSGLLSLSDIQSEIASPKSSANGQNFIWYLNLDPRPSDVSDKKGIGTPHNPAWAGTTAAEWSDQSSSQASPPPPSDATPPTVSSTAPASGAMVSGPSVMVSASASDNVGVAGVQFKLDGANLGAKDMTSPYSMTWNTMTASNGSHTLTAVAEDTAGNQSTSAPVTVTVNNDTTPPTISGVAASNVTGTGATINWTTNEAADSQVEYGLSSSYGSQTTLDSSGVTSHSLTLSGLTAGTTYNYRAKSRDVAGNLAVSTNFTFTTQTPPTGNRTMNIFPGTDVFGPAAQSLLPGDTLIVHQGTYNETTLMSIRVAGTATAPIVIQGAAGESNPIITRPATASVENTINIDGSTTYLTIRGLEIVGNGGDGIAIGGTVSFIALEDNVIHDVNVAVTLKQSMDNIRVKHNHIYNTGRNGGTGEGMYIGCNNAACVVRNSVFEQNWIHDVLSGTTQGDGIEVKVGSHSNVIRDNVIYNRPYAGIFVYGTGSDPVNIVDSNVIWNAQKGIYAVSDAIVRNNIVVNSGTGLSLDADAQVSQMKNVTAVNNTLYNNNDGIYMRWTSTALNMALANNAIYSPGKTALNTSGSAGSFAANYVEGEADRTLDGTAFIDGGTSGNAFVDPANSNFWPKTGSPLLNTASAGYAPAADFNQSARVSPYDVGAYEANGSSSNPGWAMTTDFKSAAALPPADTTPPVISGVAASSVTMNGATITWTTNEASDSQMEYGTTTSYGSQTALNTAQVTTHSQALSGLAAGTAYNYRVKSRDASGNVAVSGNFTFTTAAPPPPPPPPPPPSASSGLIGYWSFDEGAGANTTDRSGSGFNGNFSANPGWASGVVGGAALFNATDNGNDNDDPRIVIGRNFDVASLPYTITVWVNPSNFTDWRAILSKRDRYGLSQMRFDLGLAKGTGRVYTNSARSYLMFSYAPPVNTWTHLAIVATSSGTQLYVNGVLKQTMGVMSLGNSATANTVIGGTGEGTGGDNDPFKGMLDEIRVYNRALSASEVQAVFQLR
ncbi:MAG TPA: LamG-like jellyroll fold domain-containing protein, partial [Terriglobia bacterium]|nr:LamG-like jellyroll fold domain-containing protein [Terriglobia bacterium]